MKNNLKRILAAGLATVTAMSATAISAYAEETNTAETTAYETKPVDYTDAKTVVYDLTAPYNACLTTIKAATTKNQLAISSTATSITPTMPYATLPNLVDYFNVSENQREKISVVYDLQSVKVTIKGNSSTAVYQLSADVASDYYDKDFADMYSDMSLYEMQRVLNRGIEAKFKEFDGSFDTVKKLGDNVIEGVESNPSEMPFSDLNAKSISDIEVEYVMVTRTLTGIPDITLKNYIEGVENSLGTVAFEITGGDMVGLAKPEKDEATGKTPIHAQASIKGIVSYNSKTGKYTYTDDAIGNQLKALVQSLTEAGFTDEIAAMEGTTIYKAYKASGLTAQEFSKQIADAIKAAVKAGTATSDVSEADARTKATDALIAALAGSPVDITADDIDDSWFKIKTTAVGEATAASTTYKYGATAADINAIFAYLETAKANFDPTAIDVGTVKLSDLKIVDTVTDDTTEITLDDVIALVKAWAEDEVAGSSSEDLFAEILADTTIDWTDIVTIQSDVGGTEKITGIAAIVTAPAAEYTVIIDGVEQSKALGATAPVIDNVKTQTSAQAAGSSYTATCNAKEAQFLEAMGMAALQSATIDDTNLKYYYDSTSSYINSTDTLTTQINELEKAIEKLNTSVKMTEAEALTKLFEDKAVFGNGTVLDLLSPATDTYTLKTTVSGKRGTIDIPMEVNAQEWYSFTSDYDWRNSCYYLAEIVDTIDDSQGAIVSFHVDPNSLKKNEGIVATVGNYDAAKYFEEAAGAVVLRVNGQTTTNFTKLVTYDAKTSTLSFAWDDITGARYTNNVLYVRSLDLLSSMAFDMDKVQITVPTQEQFKPVEEDVDKTDDEDIDDVTDEDDKDAELDEDDKDAELDDDDKDEDADDGTEIEAGEEEKNDNITVEEDTDDTDETVTNPVVTPNTGVGAGDVNAATDSTKGSPDTGATPVVAAIPALVAGLGTFIKKRMSK